LVGKHRLRGLGAELMRGAVSQHIRLLCSCRTLQVEPMLLDTWRAVIEESLQCVEYKVQSGAVLAVAPLLDQLLVRVGRTGGRERERLLQEYLTTIRDTGRGEAARRGFSAALGVWPPQVLRAREREVVQGLIQASTITEGTEKWAEARREAVTALGNVLVNCRPQLSTELEAELVPQVFDCLLQSMEDYTVERRGDTGAWVREAAMQAISCICLGGGRQVQPVLIAQCLPSIARQATEKIERTRAIAGNTFFSLLHSQAAEGVPSRDKLLAIFPASAHINWSLESETFPLFVQLLLLPEYAEKVILGLIVSIGGITERLVKNARSSLLHQLNTMDLLQLNDFSSRLLSVFKSHQKVDRITIPLLKFLDTLLTSNCLESILESPESPVPLSLFKLCKAEVAKCGEPSKLLPSADVFCGLLSVASPVTRTKTFTQLAIFLCHKFPRLRKYTAEKLYEALLTFSEADIVPEENLDKVMDLLSETRWDEPVETVRPVRNEICTLAGVQPPAMIKKD